MTDPVQQPQEPVSSTPPPGASAPQWAPPPGSPPETATAALGSQGARLGAAIIDSLVIWIPVVLLSLVTGQGAAGLFVGLLYLVGLALYAPLMLMREGPNNGQTVGKQLLDLRVVHESGAPITFGQALLREAVGRQLISAITCGIYGLVDALWCTGDRRRQCLHDKIGQTFVLTAAADPPAVQHLRQG